MTRIAIFHVLPDNISFSTKFPAKFHVVPKNMKWDKPKPRIL